MESELRCRDSVSDSQTFLQEIVCDRFTYISPRNIVCQIHIHFSKKYCVSDSHIFLLEIKSNLQEILHKTCWCTFRVLSKIYLFQWNSSSILTKDNISCRDSLHDDLHLKKNPFFSVFQTSLLYNNVMSSID